MTSGALSPAPWPTSFSELVGVRYPIVQGPFGGFRSQALAAAVSSFGGLGSLGANLLQPAEITEAIAELRTLTPSPFAVNLWVSTEDPGAAAAAVDPAALARSLAPLAPWFRELGVALPERVAYAPMPFEAQARAVLDANVPVFSFICGVPPKEIFDECRRRGTRTIGTATTPDEAVALARAGVDAIVASGFEAGGHRGSFVRSPEESLMGTFSLVPQVADAVAVPVIAAGGIGDARGVVAAFALGASAVQLGTLLLACAGSGASPAHRAALATGSYTRTALTTGVTGRLARGIANPLLDELARAHAEPLPYPLQRSVVKPLTAAAERSGRADLAAMWAGQSAGLARPGDGDPTAVLQQLVAAVEPQLRALRSVRT